MVLPVLGRRKTEKSGSTGATAAGRARTAAPVDADAAHPRREGAKNRPTPKRREQEAKRRKPLVGNDPKASRRAEAERRREAMLTGDDRHLPERDKGPVRRYVRDVVDARWSLGELVLPLMILVLLFSVIARDWATYGYLLTYGLLVVAIIDAIVLWFRTKRRILTRFGPDTPLRGVALYLVTRTFQLRRLRMPRPMVERGAAVD